MQDPDRGSDSSFISQLSHDVGNEEEGSNKENETALNDSRSAPSAGVPTRVELGRTKKKTSWVWGYFKPLEEPKFNALCSLCNQTIFYGQSFSTTNLSRHIERRHYNQYSNHLRELNKASKSTNSACVSTISLAQGSMDHYTVACPEFEARLLEWMVSDYQSLRVVESEAFRDMCRSLNKKAPILSHQRVGQLLSKTFVDTQEEMIAILKACHFAMTTDAWTSCSNSGFVTCTIHFIDRDTWKLHHMVLGLYEKTGRSRAEDCVAYAEQQLREYHLEYKECVAVVTDTEATMVKAGRLFVERSAAAGGATLWNGCIDHLLELVTGLAFTDNAATLGAMAACCALVGFFHSSTQAMNNLLKKQAEGKAVRPIQDVVTRWWSTFLMLDRLLRLKPYIAIMEQENDLEKNLSDEQWRIASDLKALLRPFMIAQKLLEGESYVTISLVPFIIYKIRKGLMVAIEDPNSPQHVVTTGTTMLQKFNEIFGTGEEGTVATDHLLEGPNRRPKGIPYLALVASFLDPRTKAGLGFSNLDRTAVVEYVRRGTIRIAMENEARNRQHQEEQCIDEQEEEVRPHRRAVRPRLDREDNNMFDELNEYFLQDRERRQSNNNNNNDPERMNEKIRANVEAELLLFDDEPLIELQDEEGNYTSPLRWWLIHQDKYKYLSEMAIRVLCVPATSAPSERVFSTAGITIANDRARLAPTRANELVFLHEALPAVKRYRQTRCGLEGY